MRHAERIEMSPVAGQQQADRGFARSRRSTHRRGRGSRPWLSRRPTSAPPRGRFPRRRESADRQRFRAVDPATPSAAPPVHRRRRVAACKFPVRFRRPISSRDEVRRPAPAAKLRHRRERALCPARTSKPRTCRAGTAFITIDVPHRPLVALELRAAGKAQQKVDERRRLRRIDSSRVGNRGDHRDGNAVPGDRRRPPPRRRLDQRRKARLGVARLHGVHRLFGM